MKVNESPKQNQQEFFARADVKALQEIQKRNPYGSIAHHDASKKIHELAINVGAPWGKFNY